MIELSRRLLFLLLIVGPEIAAGAEPDLRAAIGSLPQDPAAPLSNDKHYLVSNESRLDFFHRHVRDLGGVHLGVGTDQNYVLAGWARSEWMVLVDIDPWVVDLHRVYVAFLREAPSSARFLRLWEASGAAEARGVLTAQGEVEGGRLIQRYDHARELVHRRLGEVQTSLRGHPSFLHNEVAYQHLARLAREGRILALRADLTGPHAMRALGEALRQAGLVVRTLYLSNAEQYFMYKAPFRTNMLALPVDVRSLVLRTLPGRPRGFEYISQGALAFQAWVRSPRTTSVYKIRGLEKGQHLVGDQEHVLGDPAPSR